MQLSSLALLQTRLHLSRDHCRALNRVDLSSPEALRACTAAAQALATCMDIPVHPGECPAGISPCQGWSSESSRGWKSWSVLSGERAIRCGRMWEFDAGRKSQVFPAVRLGCGRTHGLFEFFSFYFQPLVCISLVPQQSFVGFWVDLSQGFCLMWVCSPPRSPQIPKYPFFSPRGYRKMQAVAEQLILFETLKQNFEKSFITHITNIFELQVGSALQGSSKSWEIGIFWGSRASGTGDATRIFPVSLQRDFPTHLPLVVVPQPSE